MYSIIALAIVCAIPLVLNRIEKYEYSFLIYTFQSSILVAFYALYIGKEFNIQYFFLPLFIFPFVFFKTNNVFRIVAFVAFNELCLLYIQFGQHDWVEPLMWTEKEAIVVSIIVQVFLMVFCAVLMFALYQTQVKTEIRLISQNKKLKKAYNAKQEFLSTMSHEIRTPLNAVISIASLLDDKEKDKEEQKLLDSLKYSSHNLLNIINDILDFSKLEAEKIKLEYRKYDLNQFLQNVGETYKTLANEKGLNFNVQIDSNLAAIYFFDDVKLSQILANFVSNAIKFTETGSVKLEVNVLHTGSTHDVLSFSIIDTGIGISTDEIPLLYNSFTQIKKDITRKQEGTGLGLAISKELVKLYQSEIHVKSEVNQGSTFSFDLTLQKTQKEKLDNTNKSSNFEGKKILLVEDNQINAMVAGKILARWGIMHDLAENGELAYDYCEKEKYDLILMDLHMPIMDGFTSAELIKRKSSQNQNTPIFALTADVSDENTGNKFRFFDQFLSKPIEQEKLRGLLTDYWEKG